MRGRVCCEGEGGQDIQQWSFWFVSPEERISGELTDV